MNNIEQRSYSGAPLEVRAGDNGQILLSGVAILYGARSKPISEFRERIMPGAVTEALKKSDVQALENHDLGRFLGRTGSGSLVLRDAPDALRYEITLPNTAVGRDVAALAERGEYSGSSVGMIVGKDEWSKGDDGMPLRTVTEIRHLRDVSPVIFPAYDTGVATLSLRSWLAAQDAEELAEELEVEAVKFFRRNVY